MAGPVTDPELLRMLEGGGAQAPASSGGPVSDPALLAQLNGERTPVYRGSVLPFTKYSDGTWDNFDMKSGLPGLVGDIAHSIWSGVTAPGDAVRGKLPMTTRNPETGEARTSPEAVQRGFEMGGVVSPVNPAVRAGDFAVLPGVAKDARPPKVPVPTSEELKAAGKAGYDQVRQMGVDYSPAAVRDLSRGLEQQLFNDGLGEKIAPTTTAILRELQSAPEGSVLPFDGLIAAKRNFSNAAKDFNNPQEQLAAVRVIQAIDDFIQNPPAKGVLAGPAAEAGKLHAEANGNYGAFKRSDYLTGIADKAELKAKANNSGRNLDNTIRNRVYDVVTNPKRSSGFTEAEKGALDEIVAGTPTRNAARYLGNLLGGGGGLGQMVTGSAGGAGFGLAAGGPVGAAIGATVPPLVGVVSKSAGNKMTASALSEVEKATRMRSPLYRALMERAGVEAAPTMSKEALLKALLAAGANQN